MQINKIPKPQIRFHDTAFFAPSNYQNVKFFFCFCRVKKKSKQFLSFRFMNVENLIAWTTSRCCWTVFSLNVTNTNLNHDMRLVNDITWIKSPAVRLNVDSTDDGKRLISFTQTPLTWWGECRRANKKSARTHTSKLFKKRTGGFPLRRTEVRFYWYILDLRPTDTSERKWAIDRTGW